jgi:DNA-binding MarR family transcriptional regulator
MAKKQAAETSALEDHLGYWLRFVSNHVSHAFQTKVEALGVTVAEWVALRELFDAGEVPPSALAERLAMSRGAISKLVDRLIAKGLVERGEEGSDRRYRSALITSSGKKLVPRLARLADANDAEFFGHLDPDSRRQLSETLREIVRRHGMKNLPTD